MADQPVFDQINLVVRDMDATLAFYRKLGIVVQDDGSDWPPGSGARPTSRPAPARHRSP